jgi:hypothetical protein
MHQAYTLHQTTGKAACVFMACPVICTRVSVSVTLLRVWCSRFLSTNSPGLD